jgi:hypothetical protein
MRPYKMIALLALMISLGASSADAQPPGKVPRIGLLGASSASAYGSFIEAFRQGLRDLGYVEGKSITIEYDGPRTNMIAFPALQPSWSGSRLTSSSRTERLEPVPPNRQPARSRL